METVEKINLFDNEAELRKLCLQIAWGKDNDVGLTYEWLSSLWESHFGRNNELTLLLRDSGRNSFGLLPLFTRTVRNNGMSVRFIKPLSGLYSTNGGIPVLGDEEEALSSLLDYFNASRKWHIFELCVQAGSVLERAIKNIGKRGAFRIEYSPYESCPYLTLENSLERFLASQSANFRSNLKRKEKKLQRAGTVTLHVHSNPEDVATALADVVSIENRSWKAEQGTAITSSAQRQKFYSTLAEKMAAAHWLRIYLLKLNEQPIAFDYGLLFQGRYFMLKTSYDESFKDLSPGIVLRWQVVRDLFSMGCIEHDFLWGTEHYKSQWANGIRAFKVYRIYNRTPASILRFHLKRLRRFPKNSTP